MNQMISEYLTYLLTAETPKATSIKFFPQAYVNSLIYGIPSEIIVAVAEQESAGDPTAIGDSGTAFGLMQVRQIAVDDMIQNGYNVGSKPATEPLKNIEQGTAFLNLLRRGTGSMYQALRAYNCCGTNYRRLENENLSKSYAENVLKIASSLGYVRQSE